MQEFLMNEAFDAGDSLVVRVRENASNEVKCIVITTMPLSPNHPVRRYKVEKYACDDISTLGDLQETYEDDVSMQKMAREDVHVFVIHFLSANEDVPQTVYDVRKSADEDEQVEEVEEANEEETRV